MPPLSNYSQINSITKNKALPVIYCAHSLWITSFSLKEVPMEFDGMSYDRCENYDIYHIIAKSA